MQPRQPGPHVGLDGDGHGVEADDGDGVRGGDHQAAGQGVGLRGMPLTLGARPEPSPDLRVSPVDSGSARRGTH